MFSKWGLIVAAIAAMLLPMFFMLFSTHPGPELEIRPSLRLHYTPCFDGFQCARLRDPDSPDIVLAVIRLPARVSVHDPRYGGAIITNPGGPGGSGVHSLLSDRRSIQSIVDSPLPLAEGEGSYFDIISFDPRGINNTTPSFLCHRGALERYVWDAQTQAEGLLASSPMAFQTGWVRAMALARSCANENEHLLSHMHTHVVAADLLELVEQHGEWRARQHPDSYKANLSLKRDREEEKLLMVMDGVMDAAGYYQGRLMSLLPDADAILLNFADLCRAAGPTQCSFYSDMDIMGELNSPIEFPQMADLLSDLSYGNGSLFAQYKSGLRSPLLPPRPCEPDQSSSSCQPHDQLLYDGTYAIFCSDANHLSQLSRHDFEQWSAGLQRQSPWSGAIISEFLLPCYGWKSLNLSSVPQNRTIASNSTPPIFWIGNKLDAATPLANAYLMASLFNNSVVLEQNSVGHCSTSSPSNCTSHTVRRYIQEGVLPLTGTVCEVDALPFGVVHSMVSEGRKEDL
ncbi:TAP-like protein-domain-containing protein [Amylocarpus encephaloides]|uniref:TAP-like protein-domain-containing protein n=1 Tax=Amylocarpus encephaloides TaxID=45428 RepID=A0A9P7YQP5_9HELO|nr:TAP-like protein-domain-containing protein [Amylocarpus encephaloides]